MTAADIAAALGGRKNGRSWWARCPAHQDKRPSLELTDAGGKVLVHCWAGCPQADVIAALKGQALWPERPPLTLEERREWGRKRRAVEGRARELVLYRNTAYWRARDMRYECVKAYHRAVRYLVRNGYDAPLSDLAMDMEVSLWPRIEALDSELDELKSRTWAEWLAEWQRRAD